VTLDGSFARGNDLVRLPQYAQQYLVSLSGSSVTFSYGYGDLDVVVPLGTTGLDIAFNNGVLQLIYEQGVARLGNQIILTEPAEIRPFTNGTTPPPLTPDPAPASLLVLSPASPTSYYGNASVFGTNGAETIEALGGQIVLDASFARGGDTLQFARHTSFFDAKLSGSSLVLTWSAGDITIPIGTAGMTIDFAGDERTLRYDQASSKFLLGTQEITSGVEPVPITPLALHTEVGILA
jgi:hypothetical protein